MYIDFSQWDPSAIYHLMTQTVVPRPIAWVLTESADQNFNLAPFSYFTAVSSHPPLLMISTVFRFRASKHVRWHLAAHFMKCRR